MSLQKISLKAGVPFRRDIIGKLLLIDSCGDAGAVDVQMLVNGSPEVVMPNRLEGFRRVAAYDGVILTAAVDTIVRVFLSMEDVQLGVNKLEITNDDVSALPVRNVPGQPLAVNFAGVVNPVLGVVTVDNTDAEAIPIVQKANHIFKVDALTYQAQAVVNVAPVAVSAVASVFLAYLATRRGFRIRNTGENAIAIGGAGLTFANAAVLIQPGETWNENEAPAAAWSCICDAGFDSTINIQTIA